MDYSYKFFFLCMIQGITLYISGIDQWKVNIFRIQLASELVLNNGHLVFIQLVSSIWCLLLMCQRYENSLDLFSSDCFFYNGIVSWRLFSQVMAVSRNNICKNGLESVSRGGAIIYYAAVFLYFWVFSTPVVSLVFGSYLYICINWLHLHFDEAFSSLRIANYKSFTRFHISSDGNLEVFTLAVDKVRNYFMWSKI